MRALLVVIGYARAHAPRSAPSQPLPGESAETLVVARLGYTAVPAVVAARFVATRLRRPITVWTALTSILVAALWPLLLNFVVLMAAPRLAMWGNGGSRTQWPVHVVLAMVNIAMLSAGWFGWRMFVRAVPDIDDMIVAAPDRQRLLGWLRRRLRWQPQVIFAGGLVVVCTVVRVVHGTQGSGHQPPLMSHLVVGWTIFLAGSVLYWIYSWAEAPTRLYHCRRIKLLWYDCARTPGIVKARQIYSFIALALGVGVVAAELISYFSAAFHDSAFPAEFWDVQPFVLALTALYAGAQPFYVLALIARRGRNTALRQIGHELDKFTPGQLADPAARNLLQSYVQVGSVSAWPLTAASATQYVAAVVGSLAAYALGKF